MATRAQLLQNMQSQIPGQTEEKKRRAQRTQDILLQQKTKQAGLQPGAAPQVAAQATAQLGQQQAQIAAGGVQQQQALQQAKLQAKQTEHRAKIAEFHRNIQRQTRRAEQRLFNLDESIKSSLLDQNLQFKQDELGRTLFNERQLADYALSQAQSAEELKDYAQMVQQESQRKMQVLQAAENKIKQELANEYAKESTEQDNKLKLELERAKATIEMKIAKEKAKAANRAGMLGAAGSIVGGVAGAVVGGPAGAAAGATIGNGLFTAFG